jgi:hypothetical protein
LTVVGLAVDLTGTADDFPGVAEDLTGATEDLTDAVEDFTGIAEDLVGAFEEVGLAVAAEDCALVGLPPPLLRARIFSAACSARTTMYEVGLVKIWLRHVSHEAKE